MPCEELDQAQRQMLLLGRKSAYEKVASFLLSLSVRTEATDQPSQTSPERMVHLPMSRQDMADYLGLTIETVSRTMSRFKRLGLIGRQHVALSQIQRLKALADGSMADGATANGHSHFGQHAERAEATALV